MTVDCACATVALKLAGVPIMAVECLCDSCRAASARLARLPGASALADARGATRQVMYRKDRIEGARGGDRLREFRLAPDSPTRRIVASCCNTPMLLDFTQGHWIDVYAKNWPDGFGPRRSFAP